ncbi:hypothetical protein AKJ16_DCAP17127 [Drosera capensis]
MTRSAPYVFHPQIMGALTGRDAVVADLDLSVDDVHSGGLLDPFTLIWNIWLFQNLSRFTSTLFTFSNANNCMYRTTRIRTNDHSMDDYGYTPAAAWALETHRASVKSPPRYYHDRRHLTVTDPLPCMEQALPRVRFSIRYSSEMDDVERRMMMVLTR